MSDALTPPFDTTVPGLEVVVGDDLETWQRLNVTAVLASGLAAANPQLVGAPYADAEGQSCLPLLGIPVLVFEGTGELLVAARERALRTVPSSSP